MKEILGQTLSGRNTGDLLPQVVFSPVIYHDPRQEFKHPPSEVRSQKQVACCLSFVSLTPGTSWTRSLLYSTVVGFVGRWGVRGQARWRKVEVSDPGKGWSRTQGQECKARQLASICRASVEDRMVRQEEGLPQTVHHPSKSHWGGRGSAHQDPLPQGSHEVPTGPPQGSQGVVQRLKKERP